MDLFEVKNINGTDRALLHLDEREAALHAKDEYYKKYTAFLKVVLDYCSKIALKGASDIDIARIIFSQIKKIFNDESLMKSELQSFVTSRYPKDAITVYW